jgi:hypothetical protein
MQTTLAALLAGFAGHAYAAAQNPSGPNPGDPIRAYGDQARALSAQPADPMHAPEVKALRQLADALESMAPPSEKMTAQVARIRGDADKIEQSTPAAVHSDWTKDALAAAADALDSLGGAGGRSPVTTDRVHAARQAIAKIDAQHEFLPQRGTIDSAFISIGDALDAAAHEQSAVSMAEKQPVAGEEAPPTAVVQHAPMEPRLNLSVGGGVADFADDASRHLTKVGGMWDVRLLIGESTAIAGEIAYVGTANGVNNVMAQFASNGTILGSALEGVLRLQTPPGVFSIPVRPFLFYGLGWNHFSLVSETFRNPLAIQNNDDALVMPFGAGIQIDLGAHVAVDTRFTYRAMYGEDLLHTSDSGVPGVSSQGMSQWTWSARLGYTF